MGEKNFEKILDVKEEVSSWSAEERLYYHLYNKRGVVSRLEDEYKKVDELVKEKKVPGGWSFAYGRHSGMLERFKKLSEKEDLNKGELSTALRGMEYHLETTKEKIKKQR